MTAAAIKEALDEMRSDFGEFKMACKAEIKEAAARSEGATSETVEKIEKIEANISKAEDSFEKWKRESDNQLEELREHIDRLSKGSRAGQKDEIDVLRAKHHDAFIKYVRSGAGGTTADPYAEAELKKAAAALADKAKELGRKDVTIGAPTAGGHAVPEELATRIYERSVQMSPWRSIIPFTTIGSSDYAEIVDLGGMASGWIGETGTRDPTATPTIERVVPTQGELYALPRASEWAEDDIFFSVEDWLVRSAGREFSRAEGAAIVSGDGSDKPTGFLAGPAPVADPDHGSRPFGTLQYIPQGHASTIDSPHGLTDLVYELDEMYEDDARLVMNKRTLGTIRKLEDSSGQPIWTPNYSAGEDPTILGYPYTRAPSMPDIAANAFPVAFGSWEEGYMAVDRVGLRITRDPYTLPGFINWYIRRRQGGILRNDEAIKVLKIAVS